MFDGIHGRPTRTSEIPKPRNDIHRGPDPGTGAEAPCHALWNSELLVLLKTFRHTISEGVMRLYPSAVCVLDGKGSVSMTARDDNSDPRSVASTVQRKEHKGRMGISLRRNMS